MTDVLPQNGFADGVSPARSEIATAKSESGGPHEPLTRTSVTCAPSGPNSCVRADAHG